MKTLGKIRKRGLLIFMLTMSQLACLLACVFWFTNWLDGVLQVDKRSELLAKTYVATSQLAETIDQQVVANGGTPPPIEGVCELIEKTPLPEGAYVNLIDAQGTELCNSDRAPARPVPPWIREQLGASPDLNSARFWSPSPNGEQLLAAHPVAHCGGWLAVRLSTRELNAAAANAVGRVRLTGLVITLVLVLLSSLALMAICQRYDIAVEEANAQLQDEVERRSSSLVRTRDAIIFGLARLAESRDEDTGEHLDRIQIYTELLTRELAPKYSQFNDETIRMLGLTSSLHDIGKVGIPDDVLLKPGRLTPAERAIIERHALTGGDCLFAIKQRLGDDDFLEMACEVAYGHHERWDGSGYPFGLAGVEIPISARIVALADVYDALTSKRVYKPALSHESARTVILANAGKQFDPDVVAAFLAQEHEFRRVSAAIADEVQISPRLRVVAG